MLCLKSLLTDSNVIIIMLILPIKGCSTHIIISDLDYFDIVFQYIVFIAELLTEDRNGSMQWWHFVLPILLIILIVCVIVVIFVIMLLYKRRNQGSLKIT